MRRPRHLYGPVFKRFALSCTDPLLSILSPQYADEHDLESHYRTLATNLANILALPTHASGPLNARLRLPCLLSSILTLKCHLREWLRKFYLAGDFDQLATLAGPGSDTRLGRLRELVDDLWRYHRSLWMSTNKVRRSACASWSASC